MGKTMVRYELFDDPPQEEPWKPMGVSYSNKAEALKELQIHLPDYPKAYMAKVFYTRLESAKKGR